MRQSAPAGSVFGSRTRIMALFVVISGNYPIVRALQTEPEKSCCSAAGQARNTPSCGVGVFVAWRVWVALDWP
jgi:hypothetical protein